MLSIADGGLRRELQSILTMYLATLLNGYSSGFSAVAVPGIKEEMERSRANCSSSLIPTIEATDEGLSWFASSINIGQMVGSLLGGYCGGRFGPKRTILASCLPAALGWVVIASSPHFATLIVGRVLCGLGVSISFPNSPLLAAQYSSVKRRGGFLSLLALMLGLGILASYCLGAVLYWRFVAIIPPIIYLLLVLALWRNPESPLWLLSHRGTEDCREALEWLRATQDVGEEIGQIQKTKEQQDHGLTMTEAFRNVFSRADVRTPFLLVITHNSLLMFSGPVAIIFYAVEVLQSEEGGLDEHLASIIVGLVIVIGGILGIFAVQKLPRVRLAMISMTLMSICLAVLGGSLYTRSLSPQLQNIIKVTSVTVFTFVCNSGNFSLTVSCYPNSNNNTTECPRISCFL